MLTRYIAEKEIEKDMKKLTVRYSLTQFTYWAASTGASSFATTYLLNKGLSSGVVGTLLALSGIISCIVQPVLASVWDKNNSVRLPQILTGISLACAGCFAILLIPGVSPIGCGICYVVQILLSNIMLPLLNALCVSYEQKGYCINYGVARGIGSVASAMASLVLGYVIARLGNKWMILLLIFFRVCNLAVLLGYPILKREEVHQEKIKSMGNANIFFSKYPWYCATLLGVLFLGMYHSMTETYMIAIMERLGGNSRQVGNALFISSMVGAPVIFCSKYIRRKITGENLLKIAACTFLLKSILICSAQNVQAIYIVQLLQMTSYAFMEPTLIYYAKDSVRSTDLLTGQAFSTAAYALGCSAGNFAGGQLLTYDMTAFFAAGILMAATGVIIIFFTVTKKDSTILNAE